MQLAAVMNLSEAIDSNSYIQVSRGQYVEKSRALYRMNS